MSLNNDRLRTLKTNKKKILVTGAGGFIGFHLSKVLLEHGAQVIGYDNLNDYYNIDLKHDRLYILKTNSAFNFIKGNLADTEGINDLFFVHKPDIVVNLAAQAGVRYSSINPKSYIESNIVGFFNILEACRHYPVEHLIYASSSSVYGNQEKTPFSTEDDVNKPISLYAATKKSNELLAYTYSHLYHIPTTGLRFFTVYGPFGRPDMAYFSFTDKMVRGESIALYNNGDMRRDFTYIDDIVRGIESIIAKPVLNREPLARVYNIGNNQPVTLLDFVEILEKALSEYGLIYKPSIKEYLPMQPGDVYQTYADINDLVRDYNFKPSTTLEEGLRSFVKWYKDYYINKNRIEGL